MRVLVGVEVVVEFGACCRARSNRSAIGFIRDLQQLEGERFCSLCRPGKVSESNLKTVIDKVHELPGNGLCVMSASVTHGRLKASTPFSKPPAVHRFSRALRRCNCGGHHRRCLA